MANTQLFKIGNSQAVRIPAELALRTWDLDWLIERQGDELRTRPAQRRMSDVLGKLANFSPHFMAQGGVKTQRASARLDAVEECTSRLRSEGLPRLRAKAPTDRPGKTGSTS